MKANFLAEIGNLFITFQLEQMKTAANQPLGKGCGLAAADRQPQAARRLNDTTPPPMGKNRG